MISDNLETNMKRVCLPSAKKATNGAFQAVWFISGDSGFPRTLPAAVQTGQQQGLWCMSRRYSSLRSNEHKSTEKKKTKTTLHNNNDNNNKITCLETTLLQLSFKLRVPQSEKQVLWVFSPN